MNKYTTGARTRSWGLIQPCRLCGEPDKTRDHLFFACPYAFTIWIEVIGDLLKEPPNPDWHNTVTSLTSKRFDGDSYILIDLCCKLQSTTYGEKRMRGSIKGRIARPLLLFALLTKQSGIVSLLCDPRQRPGMRHLCRVGFEVEDRDKRDCKVSSIGVGIWGF